jgi:hypothetical protein
MIPLIPLRRKNWLGCGQEVKWIKRLKGIKQSGDERLAVAHTYR